MGCEASIEFGSGVCTQGSSCVHAFGCQSYAEYNAAQKIMVIAIAPTPNGSNEKKTRAVNNNSQRCVQYTC
jgi:hypothetical protein